MGKLNWYKRDPNKALSGMMILTLEERGAYNTVLDLIYAHDGCVLDDDRFLAGWMRVDVRVWKRIKARLIHLNKLYAEGGMLRNSRADTEVLDGLQRVESVSEANRIKGIKSWVARRKNKELAEQSGEPALNTTTTTTTSTEEVSKKESHAIACSTLSEDQFLEFWAKYPQKTKKPKAQLAFKSALKRATFDEIITGVDRYIREKPAYADWQNPQAWLNADRWTDQPANGVGHGQTHTTGNVIASTNNLLDKIRGFDDYGAPAIRSGEGAPAIRLLPKRGSE